jgi:hypothetical protein
MEARPRVKKVEKEKYIEFILSFEVQETLKSIPNHLQQKYLREGFLNQTGVKISEYSHYKIMKAIKNNQQTIGGKRFVII